MKPKLLMICLLRSSAAAFATQPRGGVGGVGNSVSNIVGSRRFLSPFTRKHSSSATTNTIDDDDSSTCTENTSTSLHQTSQNNNIHDDPIASFDDNKPPPLISSGHIAFRLARRTDVPQIAACNLATLPENYNANFYVNHMRQWPELTLVAEHIPEGCTVSSEDDVESSGEITPLREYIRGIDRSSTRRQRQRQQQVLDNSNNKPQKEIVGYVLGKVEERPINPQRQISPPSRTVPLYDEETLLQYMDGNSNGARLPQQQQEKPPTEKLGHITSLAVHSHARRLGIAASLLDQLHFHSKECYGADSVGLHVRISNKAAVALYCAEGYDVADIIPMYYGDGEDAYFMRKDLATVVSEALPPQSVSQPQQQQQQQKNQQQPRQLRRGEKERNEWLNRDATRNGSFFDNRKSMRETLSEEERAWVKNNNSNNNPQSSTASAGRNGNANTSNSPSLSGQFKRNFYTFFNGEQPMQQQRQQRRQNKFILPPWENGPEGLRLPRYSRVMRAPSDVPAAVAVETRTPRGGMSLKDLVLNKQDDDDEEDNSLNGRYEEEETALDARVASGSV
mmetsp:Transcript_19802/g.42984  ORF Transcript_19802/g.42984 Transcript_19802/m.42984 type:complete len:564 (+) Transcript_19802:163-1854(+)